MKLLSWYKKTEELQTGSGVFRRGVGVAHKGPAGHLRADGNPSAERAAQGYPAGIRARPHQNRAVVGDAVQSMGNLGPRHGNGAVTAGVAAIGGDAVNVPLGEGGAVG